MPHDVTLSSPSMTASFILPCANLPLQELPFLGRLMHPFRQQDLVLHYNLMMILLAQGRAHPYMHTCQAILWRLCDSSLL